MMTLPFLRDRRSEPKWMRILPTDDPAWADLPAHEIIHLRLARSNERVLARMGEESKRQAMAEAAQRFVERSAAARKLNVERRRRVRA